MDRGAWRATIHRVAELDMTERLTLCNSSSLETEAWVTTEVGPTRVVPRE